MKLSLLIQNALDAMEEADNLGLSVEELGNLDIIERIEDGGNDTKYSTPFKLRFTKLTGGGYAILKENIKELE